MTGNAQRPTRGTGLLEGYLAGLRARKARALIRQYYGSEGIGHLVDLGCGNHPVFAHGMDAEKKTGVDRLRRDAKQRYDDVALIDHDLGDMPLPLETGSCDVVTMLAVFEHLLPDRAGMLLGEIHRVLRDGGLLVMTTPAPWVDGLLRGLARVKLVSAEEIDEHQNICDRKQIRGMLQQAGFNSNTIVTGTFELGMNLWAAARK